jgi:hypothetical protein
VFVSQCGSIARMSLLRLKTGRARWGMGGTMFSAMNLKQQTRLHVQCGLTVTVPLASQLSATRKRVEIPQPELMAVGVGRSLVSSVLDASCLS